MQHNSTTVPSSSSSHARIDPEPNSDDDDSYDDDDDDGHSSRNDQQYGEDNESSRRKVNGVEGPFQTQMIKAKNREHAKNTRLRKKNYIETLKEDISTLSGSRDTRDRDRKITLSKLAEQTAMRKKILFTFFRFRTSMETNADQWASVLEEDFECVMPVTPYRSFPPHQVLDSRRHLTGIKAMIYDALSLHVMLQSLSVSRGTLQERKQVKLLYELGVESSIMSDDNYMCKWHMGTANLVSCGGAFEVTKHGMLFATFSAENKLRHLELTFDVMSFMQQLRRTSERGAFQVIPNIIYGSAEDERRRARNGHAHSNGHAHAHAHGIPHSAGTSSSTNGSTTGTTTSERSTGGSGSGSNADLIAGGGGGPSSSGSGSPSNSSTRSGSGSTSSQQQAQAQAMLQDSPPQQGQGERNDALGLFMESPEARAVIKATEPFDFICVNKKFREKFSPQGAKAGGFASFIRPGDNDPLILSDVSKFLKNKLPYCATLNCATGTEVARPCMCSFHPLFADGAVQQYLVIVEALSGIVSVLNLQQHPEHGSKKHQRSRNRTNSSPSGSGSNSGNNSRAGSGSGSGATDQSRSSHSSDQMLGASASASSNDISRLTSSNSSSNFSGENDNDQAACTSAVSSPKTGGRTRSTVGSVSSGASLTSRSSVRPHHVNNHASNQAASDRNEANRSLQAPANGWLNDGDRGEAGGNKGTAGKAGKHGSRSRRQESDGPSSRMDTQLTSSDGSAGSNSDDCNSGNFGSPMQQDSGSDTPPQLPGERGCGSPASDSHSSSERLLECTADSGSVDLNAGDKGGEMNFQEIDFYDKLFEDGTFDESMGKM